MKILVLATTLGAAGLVSAQSRVPAATVASTAPITIQGVEEPSAGLTAWPVIEGDSIRTSNAPAEVRMKDGTRIYIPPSSRFVVGSPLSPSTGVKPRADLRVKAVTNAPSTVSVARTQKGGLAGTVLTMLDGGAMVINDSTLQQFAAASSIAVRNADGNQVAVFDLAQLAGTFGPNNLGVAAVAAALSGGALPVPGPNGSFTITTPDGTITVNGSTSIVITTAGGGTTTYVPTASIGNGCKGGTPGISGGNC